MQPFLDDEIHQPAISSIGQSAVTYKEVSSILTPTSGFLDSYDYSLNPYSGCSFGCSYCYAAFFAQELALRDTWGFWVQVKENALHLLRKKRRRPLIGKTIYMSSVTDPYQPIERKLGLTRQLLQELLDYHEVKLVIQTRSPLVTRDIDLLQRFDSLQVNMTITTDSERVRKVFEPTCPSNAVRLQAIQEIHSAGIDACITMTPLLPIEAPEAFVHTLAATGIEEFIVQPFHPQKGHFVAGTREAALHLIEELGWSEKRYQEVLQVMRAHLPNLGEGKAGFAAK